MSVILDENGFYGNAHVLQAPNNIMFYNDVLNFQLLWASTFKGCSDQLVLTTYSFSQKKYSVT